MKISLPKKQKLLKITHFEENIRPNVMHYTFATIKLNPKTIYREYIFYAYIYLYVKWMSTELRLV